MKKLIIRILRLLGIKLSSEKNTSIKGKEEQVPTETSSGEKHNQQQPMDQTPQKSKDTKLYALLVAIDKYPIKHHRLNGCVADRDEFEKFLKRRFDSENIDLNIQTLTDDEATKANIIQGFDLFQQAEEGDICVFYYSGHGSRANSPREFWHLDPDRMNESVVAYDSRIEGGKDLMDKELAYLFWEATFDKEKNAAKKLHFTAVFDCCHAGTITRNAAFLSQPFQEVTERMAEPSPVPSRLEDYYGYEFYAKDETEQGLQLTPPPGKFIQIAASKDDETAKELKIRGKTRGVFTYNLIEVLEQTNSQMTYAELVRTMQVRVASAVQKQTPQLLSEDHELRNQLFLGGAINPPSPYYTINFNGQKWVMDAGLIQGIPAEGGYLELENGTPVNIEEVETNQSTVQVTGNPDRSRPHKAFAKGLSLKKFKIAFDPQHTTDEANNAILKAFNDSPPYHIDLTEDTSEADYFIKVWKDSLILTLPGSQHPLFKRVHPIDEKTADFFLDQADAVAKWKVLLQLNNPRSSIKEEELEIQLYRTTEPGGHGNSDPADQLDYREANVFAYQKQGEDWYQPAFRLSVKNKGDRTLYLSALFMQADFKITNRYLPLKELTPGGEVTWLIDYFDNVRYTSIPLEVYDAFHSWGITEVSEFVKLFISTDPFLNTDHYEQKALEMDVRRDFQSVRAGRRRGKSPQTHDWVTREIELKIVRPLDSQKVESGRAVPLMDNALSITTPSGVSAHVSLNSQREAERALSGNFDASEPSTTPPSNLWGTDHQSTLFDFTENAEVPAELSVLELENIEGADLVNAAHPIQLHLNTQLEANTFIVPMGYDAETGQYYPLGRSNEQGDIFIESLPQETGTRSLGRSIKLFFHKVVLAPLGFEYNWPQLALAKFTSDKEFEYETDSDAVKAAVEEATNIGIMVHGIIGNTKAMPSCLKQLKDEAGKAVVPHFDVILTFDYENLHTPIEETAKAFKQKLAEVGLGDGHFKNVTILAHSMGGLVSRWMIEKEEGHNLINHLIMCGTPNNGSPWANVQELAGVLLSRAINGAVFLKPFVLPLMLLQKLGKGLFTTLQQMHAEKSDFLQQLNDGTDPHIPYTIVMGNTNIVDHQDEDTQKRFLEKLSGRFMDMTYDALTKFLFEVANDIAVSKPSATELKGADQWSCDVTVEEVECDHLSYFVTPEGMQALAKILK
jgi:hypothetical protein